MFSVISANFLYLLLPGFIGRIIIDNFSYSKKHNNFTFFVILWAGFWYFFAPFLENLWRIKSFFALAGLWILWGMIFIFINKDMFKNFIFEVKKLRWKR